MRIKHVAAALLVAAGAAGMWAVPAAAEPDPGAPNNKQIDDVFFKAVRDKRLPITSKADAIDLAHSTCNVLNGGGTVNDALLHIKNATEWTKVDDLGEFGSLAVQAYCPGSAPG
jgi:ABC-type sugar transport system substrate-binding protein